jgi:hypothetical protein
MEVSFILVGVRPVALYYHTLQNMPAIATKLLLLLYFSQHISAPMGHLQVEYNINCLSKVPSFSPTTASRTKRRERGKYTPYIAIYIYIYIYQVRQPNFLF